MTDRRLFLSQLAALAGGATLGAGGATLGAGAVKQSFPVATDLGVSTVTKQPNPEIGCDWVLVSKCRAKPRNTETLTLEWDYDQKVLRMLINGKAEGIAAVEPWKCWQVIRLADARYNSFCFKVAESTQQEQHFHNPETIV